jgi:HK97 family phage prohead protease/HK97 family phage major capsid protein
MEFRVVDREKREVAGIAVPYDTINNGEMFARDSVTLDPEAKLMWQHDQREPIGRITEGRHTEAGFEIRATISETQRGLDAITLLDDGVINKFSVGFVMRDSKVDDNRNRIVTDAFVREVSLVSFPWYSDASVTEVREDDTDPEIPDSAPIKEETVEEITPTDSGLAEVRESIQVLEREIASITTLPATAVDSRSAGEFMQALAKGDENALRAYTSATTADSVVTPFDRDLIRIIEDAAPLRQVFSTGVTPNEGMQIVFAQVKTIVDGTAVQAAQGDDLGYYEVQLETKSVSLKTIGNFVEMSIQAILRSTVDYLNTALRGQAIALGNKLNAELIAQYKTTVAAQGAAGYRVAIPLAGATYNNWLGAITDAAVHFATTGLPIETLVVDTATFKELMALQGSDGRPVLLVDGSGTNNVGTISPTGLGGSFAGIRVVAVSQLNTNKSECAFVNSAALRQYTSASLRLESDNAINMTSAYSLGVFTAVADEYPSLIVQVFRPAS